MPSAVPSLKSAKELHEYAKNGQIDEHKGKLIVAGALRLVRERRWHTEYGHSNVIGYADQFFRMSKSETHESIRVAGALEQLPKLFDAYTEGELSWSLLKEITRVATPETEAKWVEFAKDKTVEEIKSAVRHAIKTGKDTPTEKGFGLPNLDVTWKFRFSRADAEKLRRLFVAKARELKDALGVEDVEPEQVLMYVVEQSLGEVKHNPADYAVVYQVCSQCGAAAMSTEDGRVEVEAEEVSRVEGDAHVEYLDETSRKSGPTPPAMRRKLKLREGQVCANPRCRNAAVQCHHIKRLADGGLTVMWEEVALCATCHAMIHAGLLSVSGKAPDDLEWTSHAATYPKPDRKLPVLRLEGGGTANEKSARADWGAYTTPDGQPLDMDALAMGLKKLGYSKRDAVRLLNEALSNLTSVGVSGTIAEGELLKQALKCWPGKSIAGM